MLRIRRFFGWFIFDVKGRTFLLLGVPLILTALFFLYLCLGAINRFSPYSTGVACNPQPQSQQVDFKKTLDQMADIAKIPLPIVNFNIYAINNVRIIGQNGAIYGTLLNINIAGAYADSIKTGSIREIRGANINDLFANTLIIERSFKSANFDDQTMLMLQPTANSYYTIFLLPTITSFLILWLLMVASVYAIIVFINACIIFIHSGAPIKQR